MKLTHSYNAPALPTMPENPRDDELAVIAKTERDQRDLLMGQLQELGRTVMVHILDHPGPYLVEWLEPEEMPVDPGTVKVTLTVDIKRYREPKKEE